MHIIQFVSASKGDHLQATSTRSSNKKIINKRKTMLFFFLSNLNFLFSLKDRDVISVMPSSRDYGKTKRSSKIDHLACFDSRHPVSQPFSQLYIRHVSTHPTNTLRAPISDSKKKRNCYTCHSRYALPASKCIKIR